MLTRSIGPYLSWPVDRLASLLARTRIPPNVITWSALVFNLWATVLFFSGRFAAAGGMMILAGLCDLLDGPVARRQNRVSKFGGFLDSILDRYSELMVFLGVLVYYVDLNRFFYAGLAGTAMAGSVLISYAKARAESLAPATEVGFWDRPERLVLMILGALLNRMPLVLGILAIGTNITVVHRIYHTWKLTEGESQKAGETPASPLGIARPQLNESLDREKPKTHAILTRSARRGG
ncbi:MAG TPA: CDP-alcohol phosphatidyltransferase family protein [Candidatus Acidoferrales bacterium]|nr:CDP-alcohol phosphatidyltransferase family protein [Candidatus Acidoferrales bacterium]